MKKVQSPGFSVKFTRRGVWSKPVSRDAVTGAPFQDNMYARVQPLEKDIDMMGDVPVQTAVRTEIHPHHEHTAPCENFSAPVSARTEIHLDQEHTAPRDKISACKLEMPTAQGLKEKALWHAAKAGDSYAIRLLVMDGVDLDARDTLGRTALNIATQFNQKDAIKTLLAAKEMRRMAMLDELPSSAFFDKFKKAKTVNE